MAYQHYFAWDRLLTPPLVIYSTVFVVQMVCVTFGIWKFRGVLHPWITRRMKPWQIILMSLVFVLTSAAVSQEIRFYAYDLVLASIVQLVHLANAIMIVISLPVIALDWLRPILWKIFGEDAPATGGPGRLNRFPILGAIWVIAVTAALSYFVYQHHPHIPDEVAYLMQSRFLASGALTLPAPPVQQAFDFYLMQFDAGRWFSVFPFGWPLILSVGSWLNAPWLVNPILSGVNILLAYSILRGLYSSRGAKLSTFLLCVSPWYIFMGMNFMSHTFTLTCVLVAALGVMAARSSGKAYWGWMAGFSVGMVSLIRPLEGFLLAVLMGCWAIGLGGKRLRISAIVGLVAGTVLVGGLVLPYNKWLTGEYAAFPVNVYLDQRYGVNSNAYGFGPDRGMGWALDPNPGHSPIDGLINANLNSFSVNIELFGWGMGSILLAAWLVISRQYQKSDFLMMTVILGVFIALFFYYFSGGPDFGARYWFIMIVPLVALSVRGLQNLVDTHGEGLAFKTEGSVRAVGGILILSVLTLTLYFPWRITDKYQNYLNMRPDLLALADRFDFGKSLVMVQGDNHPDYASAAIYNPLDFFADAPIYAWDKDPATRRNLLEIYPDRSVWVIQGPTLTGDGYRIVEGPVPANKLLQFLKDQN